MSLPTVNPTILNCDDSTSATSGSGTFHVFPNSNRLIGANHACRRRFEKELGAVSFVDTIVARRRRLGFLHPGRLTPFVSDTSGPDFLLIDRCQQRNVRQGQGSPPASRVNGRLAIGRLDDLRQANIERSHGRVRIVQQSGAGSFEGFVLELADFHGLDPIRSVDGDRSRNFKKSPSEYPRPGICDRVDKGIRTPDPRNHNPML